MPSLISSRQPSEHQGRPEMCEAKEVAVEVNQRALVDKVLARYPEQYTVFRELLQNADDAGAKNFVIDFRTPCHANGSTTNGTKLDLNSVKVSEWHVKNNGDHFKEGDWKRLTKIADGNPDERKIGAFGVGFYSVFSVTDYPIVKSKGKKMSVFYKDGGDHLFVKKEPCGNDKWTVIELKLKQESPLPRTFELTRFLVTSMTFLVHIEHVTISLNDRVLSTMTKSAGKPERPMSIPEHMTKKSPECTMTIKSVELIPQEIMVRFDEDPLIGPPKIPIARVNLEEESDRKPTELQDFFSKPREGIPPKEVAAPRYTGATSDAPSLKAGTHYSAKYCIYSARVSFSAPDLEKSLEAAMKKKPPTDFAFQMVFFTKEEHDKQTQGEKDSGFGSVFCGPQGLCPPLQGEQGARIFIGQSTTQTTGMACHMSGRFIPTMERGSIDLANTHVAQWNKELLYVGGFLARMAYDTEMDKLLRAWSTYGNAGAGKDLALYTIKCFTFHPSTPDPKVSNIIKDAFFHCSKAIDFAILSDKGVRPTKDIRQYHLDFAPFMKETPVLPDTVREEIAIMVKALPESLRVRPYSFKDVVYELKTRCLPEAEMAACLRWWTNTFGSKGPLSEEHRNCRDELLKVGKALSAGKEVKLSVIKTFINPQMLNVLDPEDPLPGDTIPRALISGLLDSSRVQDALGWKEMPIEHWLRNLTENTRLNQVHDIRRTFNFAYHVLVVLSTLWYRLPTVSHSEIRDILEDVACIPTTSQGKNSMHKPMEAYFPEADVFRDLPVVRQELYMDPRIVPVLEYLGVRRRCDIETFITKAMTGSRWDALDLARYLVASQEHINRVMELEIFPCGDGERRYIHQVFASTEINRQLGLDVVNCEYWDAGYEAQLLVRCGLREHPTIEELIRIASSPDPRRARIAFVHLCGPQYDAKLEKEFDPEKFASFAFIPGIRNRQECLIPHGEVFSDPSWTTFGFGQLSNRVDKKAIQKLKIRDRPAAPKLIEVLESSQPKDVQTATHWFRFLADKGVFSAGDFDKIAGLKIVPVLSEQQEWEMVTPRDCFMKSKSEQEDTDDFYRKLFRFVDFGPKANAFLRACGVKERPECIDVLKVLLDRPEEFYHMAGHEKYTAELRMIAVGYKSLPRQLIDRMRKAPIFLGYQRRKGLEGNDKYKLCTIEEVLVADDMESCRTFGDCIYIAPQEELLEKFYSEMRVKSLSSCIKYTVKPNKEHLASPNASTLRYSIIEKIPIFLHEFDEQRFRQGMYRLHWRDENQFFVRACGHLDVTKKLEFAHATGLQGREQYKTELTSETEVKSGTNLLWIKDPKADSYDIAAALCRMLFSSYKKNDVLSLMTILDTDITVLRRRGYDVDRILKEYEDKLRGNGHSKANGNSFEPPTEAPPPPIGGPATSASPVPKVKKWWDRLRKDPKLGEVKPSDIDGLLGKVKDTMQQPGGEDDKHISNQEKVGGGRKQKNVAYCDEKRVAKNDLEECPNLKQKGQITVWKLRGTVSDIPQKELEAFVNIISELAKVFEVNQTRCHVFYHTSDSSLMGFNRKDQIYFGLAHYLENHKEKGVTLGQAYVDWYYIMAHEMAHVQTPYHDEHHELLFSALTTKYLTKLHDLIEVRKMFKCTV